MLNLILAMLQSSVNWFLGPSAQEPLNPRTTITKRELLAIVTASAVIFRFCPEQLKIFRDIGIIMLIVWLTSVLYDLWMAIPPWAIGIANHFCSSNMSRDQPKGNTLSNVLKDSAEIFKRWKRQLKAAIADFIVETRAMFANVLSRLSGFIHPRLPQAEDTEKPPQSDGFYGILIRTPAVHRYGPISDHLLCQTTIQRPIPWDTHDTSSIPDMVLSLSFRTHLSFALVKASVWTSRNLTLFQKLRTARCWDISSGNERNDNFTWTEARTNTIIGVKDLGLVEDEADTIGRCQIYSNLIWSEFKGDKYMKIWWNDVDYALILTALVVGPRADGSVKQLFKEFYRLRCEKSFMTGWRASMITGAAMFFSAGTLAPVAAPLFLAGWATAAGSGVTAFSIMSGEARKGRQRLQTCGRLVRRFPQLEDVLAPFTE